jgi:hypothetical protein
MIRTEYYTTREDGVVLNRTFSDAGFYIVQNETGIKYSEAVDVMPCKYTYTETDEPIPAETEATEQDYLNALNELGVKTDEESNA